MKTISIKSMLMSSFFSATLDSTRLIHLNSPSISQGPYISNVSRIIFLGLRPFIKKKEIRERQRLLIFYYLRSFSIFGLLSLLIQHTATKIAYCAVNVMQQKHFQLQLNHIKLHLFFDLCKKKSIQPS